MPQGTWGPGPAVIVGGAFTVGAIQRLRLTSDKSSLGFWPVNGKSRLDLGETSMQDKHKDWSHVAIRSSFNCQDALHLMGTEGAPTEYSSSSCLLTGWNHVPRYFHFVCYITQHHARRVTFGAATWHVSKIFWFSSHWFYLHLLLGRMRKFHFLTFTCFKLRHRQRVVTYI